MTISILTITASISHILIVQCVFEFRDIQMQTTYNWYILNVASMSFMYQNKTSAPELTSEKGFLRHRGES